MEGEGGGRIEIGEGNRERRGGDGNEREGRAFPHVYGISLEINHWAPSSDSQIPCRGCGNSSLVS